MHVERDPHVFGQHPELRQRQPDASLVQQPLGPLMPGVGKQGVGALKRRAGRAARQALDADQQRRPLRTHLKDGLHQRGQRGRVQQLRQQLSVGLEAGQNRGLPLGRIDQLARDGDNLLDRCGLFDERVDALAQHRRLDLLRAVARQRDHLRPLRRIGQSLDQVQPLQPVGRKRKVGDYQRVLVAVQQRLGLFAVGGAV